MKRQKWLKDDEYTDDYMNAVLLEKSLKKWDVKVGVSPIKGFSKKPKYKDANWMN